MAISKAETNCFWLLTIWQFALLALHCRCCVFTSNTYDWERQNNIDIYTEKKNFTVEAKPLLSLAYDAQIFKLSQKQLI